MFSDIQKRNSRTDHGPAREMMVCAKHVTAMTLRMFIVHGCMKRP